MTEILNQLAAAVALSGKDGRAPADVSFSVEVRLAPIVSCSFDQSDIEKLAAMSDQQREAYLKGVFGDLAKSWLSILSTEDIGACVESVEIVDQHSPALHERPRGIGG